MPISLTFTDILYAAVLALFVTWLIKTLYRVFKLLVTRSAEIAYNPNKLDAVLERCHSMFPRESISINGVIYRRGMRVRVLTNERRVIEGEFVGTNSENMACFITKSSIVAQELDTIAEIKAV